MMIITDNCDNDDHVGNEFLILTASDLMMIDDDDDG